MAETLRSRPSADMRDAGREVKKQGDGRDLIPVIVSHVVSPDQMYVQHASSAARKNLQRFTAFCLWSMAVFLCSHSIVASCLV